MHCEIIENESIQFRRFPAFIIWGYLKTKALKLIFIYRWIPEVWLLKIFVKPETKMEPFIGLRRKEKSSLHMRRPIPSYLIYGRERFIYLIVCCLTWS